MYGSKRRTEEIRALRKLGGQWLKKQRETVGFSQREFAKEVGLPYYTFISQVESGTARIPRSITRFGRALLRSRLQVSRAKCSSIMILSSSIYCSQQGHHKPRGMSARLLEHRLVQRATHCGEAGARGEEYRSFRNH